MAGEFYDHAQISVQAGGGGDIYIVADAHLNTLLPFRDQRRFKAERGGNGGGSRKHGRDGKDLTIRVPPGTIVRATIGGEQYEVDLATPGMRLLAARGGKGGLGT